MSTHNDPLRIELHYSLTDFPSGEVGAKFHGQVAELRALLEGTDGIEVVENPSDAELHIILLDSVPEGFLNEIIHSMTPGKKIWCFVPRSTVPGDILNEIFSKVRNHRGIQGIFPYDDIDEIWRKVLLLVKSTYYVPAHPGTMIDTHLRVSQ